MANERVESALTSEEWATCEYRYRHKWGAETFVGTLEDHGRALLCCGYIPTHEPGEDPEEGWGTFGPEEIAPGPSRHALAALALHGQPFGFTWEDVAAIRANCAGFRFLAEKIAMSAMMEAEVQKLLAIADRIAALLPPRETK